jgi:hypothetical protein
MVPLSLLVVVALQLSGSASAQEQLPPFPNATAGTFFSGVFSDGMVLQRGSAPAAVYGAVVGATAGTAVTVTVADGVGGAPYAVRATVEPTTIRVQAGSPGRVCH